MPKQTRAEKTARKAAARQAWHAAHTASMSTLQLDDRSRRRLKNSIETLGIENVCNAFDYMAKGAILDIATTGKFSSKDIDRVSGGFGNLSLRFWVSGGSHFNLGAKGIAKHQKTTSAEAEEAPIQELSFLLGSADLGTLSTETGISISRLKKHASGGRVTPKPGELQKIHSALGFMSRGPALAV